MNTSSLVGLSSADDDARPPARAVEQRPAGVAGVDGGVDLDEAVQHVVGLGVWNDRSSPDTTPVLIEPYSPNGLPTMYASLPIRRLAGLPSDAGTTRPGGWSGLTTAMSVSSSAAVTLPGILDPSAKRSVIVSASSTTWRP